MMVIYVQVYEPKALRVSHLLKELVEINEDNWAIHSFIRLSIQHTLHALYMAGTVTGIGIEDRKDYAFPELTAK